MVLWVYGCIVYIILISDRGEAVSGICSGHTFSWMPEMLAGNINDNWLFYRILWPRIPFSQLFFWLKSNVQIGTSVGVPSDLIRGIQDPGIELEYTPLILALHIPELKSQKQKLISTINDCRIRIHSMYGFCTLFPYLFFEFFYGKVQIFDISLANIPIPLIRTLGVPISQRWFT